MRLDPGSAAARPPLVVVTLADGTRLSEDVTAVLGTVNNPMTRDQVVAKARELMMPVLGAAPAAKLIAAALDLERVKSVRELRPLLQKG